MRHVGADDARAAIASRLLGAPAPGDLGAVTLHPHQVEAVERLLVLLDTAGGALLADDVGLGKTFTALAVARDTGALVIAPSALRNAWLAAARRAGVAVAFASFEELSRGTVPAAHTGLVIVDEAHHLRTPTTNRFAAARELCRSARVLLLSATPVQNSEEDLRAVMSLFLGEVAHALPLHALSRYVVRRGAVDVPSSALRLPGVRPPKWLDPIEDADCLDRILSLPDCVPPRDGGVASALQAYSLARQWASSRAALIAALQRRSARGHALVDSLATGRLPTRSEMRAWVHADGAQQLAMAELLVPAAPEMDGAALLAQARRHLDAVRELREWIAVTPDPDVARAARLRELLLRHPGERIIAFSEYTDTITALFRLLLRWGRVAMLTHAGGRVAGGAISRSEILARFAPGAGASPPERDRIDLLLSTDVLSEGVSLHDASVVVHLDLAWNPARLEQRVGRVRRIGATRDSVGVYLMPPPTGPDQLLRLEERLHDKLARAARSVGLAGEIVPGATPRAPAAIAREARVTALLRPWAAASAPTDPVIGASRAPSEGAIACVTIDGTPRLVAVQGEIVSDGGELPEALVAAASGPEAAVPTGLADAVARQLERWLRRVEVGSVVNLSAIRLTRSRRATLQRVEGISRRTPRHARPRVAPLVEAARAAATATLSAGAERVLSELSSAPMADDAWLQAVGQFAELHARPRGGPPRIDAILLLVADR